MAHDYELQRVRDAIINMMKDNAVSALQGFPHAPLPPHPPCQVCGRPCEWWEWTPREILCEWCTIWADGYLLCNGTLSLSAISTPWGVFP